jgi:hypothetical protein
VLPIGGAPPLALSPDGCLLAVASRGALEMYATSDLLAGRSNAQAVQRYELGGSAVQMEWRPAPPGHAGPPELALVTSDGRAWTAAVDKAPEAIGPQGVRCLAWSPDGAVLALGHGHRVTLLQRGSGRSVALRVAAEVEGQSAVDSVEWAGRGALVVGSAVTTQGEQARFVRTASASAELCGLQQTPHPALNSARAAARVHAPPQTARRATRRRCAR